MLLYLYKKNIYSIKLTTKSVILVYLHNFDLKGQMLLLTEMLYSNNFNSCLLKITFSMKKKFSLCVLAMTVFFVFIRAAFTVTKSKETNY